MRRTLVELVYLALGLGAAVLIASLSAWAVPPIRDTIWTVAYCAMGIEILLQLGSIRNAWRMDRAARRQVVQTDG